MRVTGGRSLADMRSFRALITMLAVLVALALVYIGWDIVTRFAHIIWLLVFAGLLAFILGPAVSALERHGVPRAMAVLGLYVVILGSIGLGIYLAVGPLTTQLTSLTQHLPSSVATLNKHTGTLDRFFIRWHLPFRTHTLQTQALSAVQRVASGILPNAIAYLTAIAAFVVDLVLVLVISIYMLIDARRIHDNLLRLVPERYRDRAFFVEAAVVRVLGGYIRGQLLMALLIGALYGIGCWLLGVHYPLIIGVLAGLFELMPMIGPVLGAIPALAIALSQSTSLVIWVLLYYLAIQQLESHVIGPRITGHAVGLHPLGAILALAAGVELDGLVGALLGVPVAGVIYVLVVAIYWEATGRGTPVAKRTELPRRPRIGLRRRSPTRPLTQDPVTVTSSVVAGMGGDAAPTPQALAGLEDKAASLRETFERGEAQRTAEEAAAGEAATAERSLLAPVPEDDMAPASALKH